jgi:hypothetical protein
MKLNTTKKTVIDEVPYGIYVWEMPDGKVVKNENGDFLNIASTRGDLRRMTALAEAARSFGITEGKPLFLPGARQIDDEEYEKQKQRLAWGLVPDEDDVAENMEALRNASEYR